MDALCLDANEAQLSDPAAFREMHVTCARCGEKSACRKALDNGTAATEFTAYCGNAGQMLDIKNRPELLLK
jgi:hypothetical protein